MFVATSSNQVPSLEDWSRSCDTVTTVTPQLVSHLLWTLRFIDGLALVFRHRVSGGTERHVPKTLGQGESSTVAIPRGGLGGPCPPDFCLPPRFFLNLNFKFVWLTYTADNFFFIYNYLKSCVWLLLVAITLPVTSASHERSFSKRKLVKIFPRNSMTSERLGETDLISDERYELKNIFRWFCWWIDSRHDNRRIEFNWGDDDIKFQCRLERNAHLQRG